MKILNPAIRSFIKLRRSYIEHYTHNPINAQTTTFNDLISSAQFTEFGKKYDFPHINNFKDFKKSVPIHTYEDIYPYIKRMMDGEQNILWPSPIRWFAKSSGTTSDKSKFIPVSDESIEENHFRGSRDILALYFNNIPESEFMHGKVLIMGGSHKVNQLNDDVSYGDLSAVLMQNMAGWQHTVRTPGLDIALMEEWESKLELMAQETSKEDVRYIAGVPTWTAVLLNKIKEQTGENDIHKIWPNLELYIHGGVNFEPYKDQFAKFFPSKPINYIETYNASECFIAVQDILGHDGMLLCTKHSVFYEFMPLEELGKENPKTLQLEEVELNKSYALVISTNSGLWRYALGDTIAFTSLHPFRIKVTGRTKHFINAFGEEVMIENTDHAITAACKETNAQLHDYTAAPIYFADNNNGAHQWLIEVDIAEDQKENFVTILDQELQNVNSDYEAKRYKDLALRKPDITFVKEGTFTSWLKSKNKLGGQHKIPRLSNDRKIMEELLEFI